MTQTWPKFFKAYKGRKSKKVSKPVKNAINKALMNALATKYVDLATSWSPTSTLQCVAPAMVLTEGEGDNDRIGDTIKPMMLEISLLTVLAGLASNDVTGLGANRTLRTIICIDHICDGNLVTAQDIFEANTNVQSSYNQVSQLNKPKRFSILYDSTVNLVKATSDANYFLVKKFDLSKRAPMKYIGNSGASGSLGINQVFVLQMTDSALTDIASRFYSRLTFKDA